MTYAPDCRARVNGKFYPAARRRTIFNGYGAPLLYNQVMFQNRVGRVFEQPTLPLWQRLVLFSIAYFLSAWLASVVSPTNSANVSFWLPAGLFVSVLLLN